MLDTGYAVHISRLSASGRCVYTVGRDGLTTIIDMWYEEPTTVATVRLGSDARPWTPPSSRATRTST